MTQNKRKKISKEDRDFNERVKWQTLFVESIVQETYRLLEEQKKTYGQQFADDAVLNIIASLISTLTYSVLANEPKPNSAGVPDADEHYEVYAGLKFGIQAAVAAGFEGAVKTWSGVTQEYHCSIEPIPEPVNKFVC